MWKKFEERETLVKKEQQQIRGSFTEKFLNKKYYYFTEQVTVIHLSIRVKTKTVRE